ncbi:hydantoinase B/oxoprolinase family protein [Natrarchaeobius chitinivorans]|nr:hydantoinase B/oxoprolinase family protein [Natrarchaeobius chitinivorans]
MGDDAASDGDSDVVADKTDGDSVEDNDYGIEPYLMTVLSKKFEMATRDMTQSLLRSARSGVISVARDFSSAITLFDGRQFMIDEGLPVHLVNVHFVPRRTRELHDEIRPGDCFLTNSPYAGNTHHADYTLHAPVFYDDEPLFWVVSRAHQADIGANEPSTYLPDAENVYQEAMHFPSVKVQEDYEDREDIVRMCKLNIRAGDTQWYGDYRAQIASIRTGEERIRDLCDRYGPEMIKQFSRAWLQYGESMMRDEIGTLPDATVEHVSRHDPVPGAEEGIPVRVKLSIDPDEERIIVDLTDSMANVPAGFNLTEATTVAGAYAGVFNNVDSNTPRNHGSIDRISVKMSKGTVVGEPEYPAATATSTTNVSGVLFNAVQAAFSELGEPYGLAEGCTGIPPNAAVISGTDFRHDDEPYVNQIILRGGGGPGVYGHDGWVMYGLPGAAGVMHRDSVEIDERKFPILIERNETLQDTEGAGRFRGAPGSVCEYGPRNDPMTAAYIADGIEYPPQGVQGGGEGGSAGAMKVTADGDEVKLPGTSVVEIEPGERIRGIISGGGGYGDPLERNPEAVRKDAEEGLISLERAQTVYGVVLSKQGDVVEIDWEATRRSRNGDGGGVQ